ncbi:MAG: hypothetical protein WBW73_25990 [Rhodoplanes sp.]
MGILTDNTFRISQTAGALRITPRQVVWLVKHIGDAFDHEDERRGWRRFSLFDICRLSLIRHLMEFGCAAGDAAQIALDIFDTRRLMAQFEKVPEGGLTSYFAHLVLIVERSNDRWTWHTGAVRAFDIAKTPDAFVLIKLGLIVADVEDGLAEWSEGD